MHSGSEREMAMGDHNCQDKLKQSETLEQEHSKLTQLTVCGENQKLTNLVHVKWGA